MATIFELKGSGDIDAGSTGASSKKLYIVRDGQDQLEAYNLAFTTSPQLLYGILRGKINVEEWGNGFFHVQVDYSTEALNDAPSGSGSNPTPGDQGPPTQPPGNSQPIGSELSFSTGGGTERIYFSKETKQWVRAGGGVAPDFKNLINVTADGGAQGCEVVSAKGEFTISRRFDSMAFGWFVRMMRATATTNKFNFWGATPGEVLFLGADGSFKPSEQWSIGCRFSYSKTKTTLAECKVGDIQFNAPIAGHDYVWCFYVQTVATTGGVQYPVSIPKYGYVERVYDAEDFRFLGVSH